MLLRFSFFCFLLTACGPGLIPCPVVETPNFKQSTAKRKAAPAFVAKAEEDPKSPYARTSKTHERYVSNVTLEEWDCPRPGDKKYLPRKVKQNIKRNWKKIQSNQADSLAQNTRR